jgi:hypothetical protein
MSELDEGAGPPAARARTEKHRQGDRGGGLTLPTKRRTGVSLLSRGLHR